jgi:putative transposase
MVTILREAERTTVAEAAKKQKVSDATIYAWRKHLGRMEAVDVKRLMALELESSRLKEPLPSEIWTSRSSRRSTQKNGEPADSALHAVRCAGSNLSPWSAPGPVDGLACPVSAAATTHCRRCGLYLSAMNLERTQSTQD